MKKTSKKYMEKEIKEAMQSMLINADYLNPVVLKRNVGHISLCAVDFIPGADIQNKISKICREKIVFKERGQKEIDDRKIKASYEKFIRSMDKEKIKKQKRLNRKAKRKKKKILKTVYRGFAPTPTSVRTLDPGWVSKKQE
jgi:hypothetical protein